MFPQRMSRPLILLKMKPRRERRRLHPAAAAAATSHAGGGNVVVSPLDIIAESAHAPGP
jgi:hypothetical protein